MVLLVPATSIFALRVGSKPIIVASADTTSCPASSTLRFTDFGGVPSTFNELGGYSSSGFILASIMYPFGTGPPVFPNGTSDMQVSATDWIKSNANYTQWEFNVSPGLKWSNGDPINASDILNTYGPNFALNPSYDPVNVHQEVAKEYALNSSTAVYVLNQTDAHFADKISMAVAVPLYPASFISQGPDYPGFNSTATTLVGSGPFYVSGYTGGSATLIMLRNPYYKPLPGVCEIIVNFVEGESSVVTDLLAGSTDFGQIDAPSLASFPSNSHYTIVPGLPGTNGVFIINYNTSVFPYNQLAFRQALLEGTNQSEINQQAYFGYGGTDYNGQGGVPPLITSVYNPNQVAYNYSTTKALSLLHSIGYTTASDGTLHYPNGTAVSLSLWYDTSHTEQILAAQVLKTDWAKLGIDLSITGVSTHQVRHGGSALEYVMYLAPSGGAIYGSPFWDSYPTCDTWDTEWPCPYTSTSSQMWIPDPHANAEYWSNYSAIANTDNFTQMKQSIDNIQQIQAQYLPFLSLQIGRLFWVVNTQKFTGLGAMQSEMDYVGEIMNPLSLADLQPVGASNSTTSTTGSTSTNTGSGVTSSQQTTSSSQSLTSASSTSSTSSTSASSSSSSSETLIIAAVVIVVVVVLGALLFMRRGRAKVPG
jgi:ABC-type transport system substrate-binding protein